MGRTESNVIIPFVHKLNRQWENRWKTGMMLPYCGFIHILKYTEENSNGNNIPKVTIHFYDDDFQ